MIQDRELRGFGGKNGGSTRILLVMFPVRSLGGCGDGNGDGDGMMMGELIENIQI
jgi:hypothetical protein